MSTHCGFFHGKDLSETIGFYNDQSKWEEDQATLKQYANLKLASSGKPSIFLLYNV